MRVKSFMLVALCVSSLLVASCGSKKGAVEAPKAPEQKASLENRDVAYQEQAKAEAPVVAAPAETATVEAQVAEEVAPVAAAVEEATMAAAEAPAVPTEEPAAPTEAAPAEQQ